MYSFLLFVDELHNYLQFLLPVLVYSLLFHTPKIIRFLVTIVWVFLQALIVIRFNAVSDIQTIIVITIYLILPILFLEIVLVGYNKYFEADGKTEKTQYIISLISCSVLILFFATQILTNGCILIHLQNWLASQYTNLTTWKSTTLFGSPVLGYNLVFVSYCIAVVCLGIYLYWLVKGLKKLS